MEIEIPELIKTIENQRYEKKDKRIRKTTFNQRREVAFQPLIEFISKAVQDQKVAQANLKIMGTEVVISLETCVINLPFSSIRPLKRVVGSQKKMAVNVYVMIADPKLNRSKFRIDELASANDFVKNPAADLKKITNWLNTQIKSAHEYQKAVKAKPKKKTTRKRRTRRTSRKRTNRRRKTTRKRTSRRRSRK